ncbi:hypothetical protein GF1_13790 [Desulfolithobacter dissulfuricans]|uniref:Response regulatory domain-containing protein n=1 Tax=Desulfolithobacter dissulfuricans TaxID=2795293 RepID=A0A915U053_9BACT|nr:response regulator [Desulfolithobacter dissulfuricans]BCO09003.1 hypothetical protein GF1_13790 [Desulfolithobacter dissulfuricans]
MLNKKIKVLVVDDTVVYRKAVSDILSEMPGVEVVGVAHNGKIAMSKVRTLKPDLLTLDIEMPEMNGIEVLEALQKEAPDTSAIMVSTLTTEGGEMTMKALELGAFDFILKPSTNNILESKKQLHDLLAPLIKAFQRGRTTVGAIRGRKPGGAKRPRPGPLVLPCAVKKPFRPPGLLPVEAGHCPARARSGRVNPRSSPLASPPEAPMPWPG